MTWHEPVLIETLDLPRSVTTFLPQRCEGSWATKPLLWPCVPHDVVPSIVLRYNVQPFAVGCVVLRGASEYAEVMATTATLGRSTNLSRRSAPIQRSGGSSLAWAAATAALTARTDDATSDAGLQLPPGELLRAIVIAAHIVATNVYDEEWRERLEFFTDTVVSADAVPLPPLHPSYGHRSYVFLQDLNLCFIELTDSDVIEAMAEAVGPLPGHPLIRAPADGSRAFALFPHLTRLRAAATFISDVGACLLIALHAVTLRVVDVTRTFVTQRIGPLLLSLHIFAHGLHGPAGAPVAAWRSWSTESDLEDPEAPLLWPGLPADPVSKAAAIVAIAFGEGPAVPTPPLLEKHRFPSGHAPPKQSSPWAVSPPLPVPPALRDASVSVLAEALSFTPVPLVAVEME